MSPKKPKSWDEMFERLRQHKDKHPADDESGTIPEPTDDPELAAWVRDQRRQYKALQDQNESDDEDGDEIQERPLRPQRRVRKNEKKKGTDWYELNMERVGKLDDLGFTWDMSHDLEWKKRFEELCEYKERHGDCIVPARYAKNPELGRWVMTQRRQHVLLKKGRPHRMTKERKELLDSVGFKWIIRKERGKHAWKHHFEQLEEFKKLYGHADVPNPYPSNLKLGEWVQEIRMQFNRFQQGKTSSLTKELIETLNNMGFLWEPLEYSPNMMLGMEGQQQVMQLVGSGADYNPQQVMRPAHGGQQAFAPSEEMMRMQSNSVVAANASMMPTPGMVRMNIMPVMPQPMNNAFCVLVPIHPVQMYVPPQDPTMATQGGLSYVLPSQMQMYGNRWG